MMKGGPEVNGVSKRALICGACGQDGSLLARLLLDKGYEVWGTSRDAQVADIRNLRRLGIEGRVQLISMNQADFRSVISAITRAKPAELYVLSGQTSVGLSFEQPAEALQSIALGALNVLECVKLVDPQIRTYFAGSSEAFGDLDGRPADEQTPFHPRSPYGVSKASAFWLVKSFRDSFGLFCVSGILFNHESPLRPERFVTQKIIRAARQIAGGEQRPLVLGDLRIVRDWGWAPEYVEAIWLMMQQAEPLDLVIATGRPTSLGDFTAMAFQHYGLDASEWLQSDERLFRPAEIMWSAGDPSAAEAALGWRARATISDIVAGMADDVI